MKKVLLALTVTLLFGCDSMDKKATKTTTPAAAHTAADKTKKFEDEDISKSKPKAAASASSGQAEFGVMTCKGGSDDSRTLEIAAEGSGCKVDYTKAGGTQTVANAANDIGYCTQVRDRIKDKLEAAGFKCE